MLCAHLIHIFVYIIPGVVSILYPGTHFGRCRSEHPIFTNLEGLPKSVDFIIILGAFSPIFIIGRSRALFRVPQGGWSEGSMGRSLMHFVVYLRILSICVRI